jgi:hypothetical protein
MVKFQLSPTTPTLFQNRVLGAPIATLEPDYAQEIPLLLLTVIQPLEKLDIDGWREDVTGQPVQEG